jgi:thiamine-phosphate pyrophosphorylase
MTTIRRFPETDLYGITASQFSLGRSNMEVVRQMLEAGIKIIQYREKDFSMAQKYRECLAIRELASRYSVCFIVNDDVHLALAVESDGVHIGQDDLPVEKVRELVGDKMLIGLSTHSPEQADKAVRSGVADYIGVGPLYQTFTKKDVQAPVGLGYLDYVAAHHRIPFVAIGGIKESNVADVICHGAGCVCLVTEITGARDIGAKIQAIRRQIQLASIHSCFTCAKPRLMLN